MAFLGFWETLHPISWLVNSYYTFKTLEKKYSLLYEAFPYLHGQS